MTAPHIKHTAVRIAVSAAFLLSCLFIKQTAAAVGAAVSMCIGQLIPSLYVFLILANLYPPITVSHPEKRLPRGFFGTLLLTVTGGFPIGAVCVRRAYQNGQISLRTAKRLSLVMCCCGPGFLVNFVGGSLCGSTAAGWLMFAAQILTLLPEVWFALLRTDPPERNQTKIFVSSGLSESLLAAAKSMANICTVVILFYAVNGMLSPLLIRIPPVCRELILGLIEVTAGCGTLHSVSGMTRLCLLAFFCGFGGLCVHIQIYGILKECAPRAVLFTAARLFHAFIQTGVFYLLAKVTGLMQRLSAANCIAVNQDIPAANSTTSPTMTLLLVCSTLLFCAACAAKLPDAEKFKSKKFWRRYRQS